MGHYTDQPEDNLLGLTDHRRLDEEEARGFARAELAILRLEYPLHLTTGTLLDLHRTALTHLYEWAGQWRRSNPNVGAYLPPPFQQVPVLMAQFVEEVNFRLGHTQSADDLAALLAWAHHRLVAIHPFTNGNGRMARLLTNVLAAQAGYAPIELYQRNASDDRDRYLRAIRQADAHDFSLLQNLIRPQLGPPSVAA